VRHTEGKIVKSYFCALQCASAHSSNCAATAQPILTALTRACWSALQMGTFLDNYLNSSIQSLDLVLDKVGSVQAVGKRAIGNASFLRA